MPKLGEIEVPNGKGEGKPPKNEVIFEFGEGEDLMVLLFPDLSSLKSFHHAVEVALEVENDDRDLPGRYITHTGTLKKLNKESEVVDA